MWNVESSEQTADTRLGSVTFVCETAEGCVCSLGEQCVVATLVVRSADVRLLDWQCEFQSLWQFRRAKLTRGPPTLFCASATTPTQSVYKSPRSLTVNLHIEPFLAVDNMASVHRDQEFASTIQLLLLIKAFSNNSATFNDPIPFNCFWSDS